MNVHVKTINGFKKAPISTTNAVDGSGVIFTEERTFVAGDNFITLTSAFEEAKSSSLYLVRTTAVDAACNPAVDYIEVTRPMNPVLKKVTVNGVAGTPVANVISIEVPASTTQGQLEAIAYDWVSNNDAWTAAHTPAAANAWAFGVANTVTLTDKDGDESVYTITVTKAEASHDATLSDIKVGGVTVAGFDAATLSYDVELPKGTVIDDLPTVSYTLNHAGAAAVKTDATALPGATTIVVTAEDGTTKNTYTINFTVSTKDKVVIFDGSTMTAVATSPDATTGLSWNVVGISVSDKSITGYPKALATGGSTGESKHIKISVPTKYEAQFEIGQATNSNGNERNAFVKTTAKPGDSEALFTISNSVATEATIATSGALTGGKDYYLHSDQSINFVKIVAYLDRVSEAPAISAQPADLAVCDASTNANALSVTASVEAGTLSYQWYKVVEEGDDEAVGTNSASYVPTAVGEYYVVVTNAEGEYTPSSKKSEAATVSEKPATEITGTVNVKGDLGTTTQKLSVTATGAGELTYAWYAYDIANEETTGAQLSATNELGGLTITEETQYYQVTVTGDCGSVSEILTVSKWIAVEQADVTGSMTWDWTSSCWNGHSGVELLSNERTTDVLMANTSSSIVNSDDFRSDMLVVQGQWMWREESGSVAKRYFQGTQIKFHTTVPGTVIVYYRSTSSGKEVQITINNTIAGSHSTSDFKPTNKVFVPAGDVTIVGQGLGDYTGLTRIQKIVFTAEPDYTRDVTEGRYGTICLPNGGVMAGAELFEIAYYGETTEKIFFDNIPSGEMEAGIPYIFLPKAGVSQLGVFYTDAANASAGNRNGLYGSYTQEAIEANVGNYILLNNQYCAVVTTVDPVYVGANRAYIKLGEINPSEPALAPGRRRVAMGVQGEQVATGMESIQPSEISIQKVLINGQLFILRGGKMYDATGRLVK